MIHVESFVKVVDNSGAKMAKCIKVKSKSGHSFARVGDIVVVSIQSLRPYYGKDKIKIKKSDVMLAVVVQTKFSFNSKQYRFLGFDLNSVVLITQKKKSYWYKNFFCFTSFITWNKMV
uniref:ribosomal protein L14 n=1 Tax=Choristocarpus tenellus TaxID=116065 RepID=UPI002E791072|nr:ribosomal protein L14 [Choristocarpus tenellus]WBP69808.1 ribosomal protein L14 [Choristocarpus tenellus]